MLIVMQYVDICEFSLCSGLNFRVNGLDTKVNGQAAKGDEGASWGRLTYSTTRATVLLRNSLSS